METHYTMSTQEFNRLEVLQKLLDKRWSQKKASEALGISVRQVQRLMQSYRLQGVLGLVSKKERQAK